MSDPRTRIVEHGYDTVSDTFAEWRDRIVADPRRAWADVLTSRLPDGARVLELGCGAGVPDARLLAERYWLGTTMFFSSFPPERTRRLLAETGFELLLDEVVTMLEPEPEGEATVHWVLCGR